MNIGNELRPVGRLSRLGFWLRHFIVLPMALALCVAASAGWGALWDGVPAAGTLLFLVSCWGRRLHDRGHSAWWLCVVVVPIAGPLLLFIECGLRGSSSNPIGDVAAADYKTV